MKKLLYLFLLIGLAVSSCNKPEVLPTEKEVVFQASMGGSNFKDGDAQAFDCTTEGATYAVIKINGIEQTVNLIRDEYGAVYTESIKLPASADGATTYSLDSFILYNDEGDEVLAIPMIGSDYAKYVTNPLPMDFDVDAFYKNEVPIQVLCFDETVINQFGFSWFSLDVTAIREICFFGDICVDANNYMGSLYEGQRNGLQHDMPAIFEVRVSTWNKTTNDWNAPEVIKNNETSEAALLTSDTSDDYDWLGEGAALCVQFPDYAGVDKYKIELLVYLSDGNGGFSYQSAQTWNFDDNNFPVTDIDADGVIDFVIGSCVPGADIIIPPTDPPTDPPANCGECDGKMTQLRLQYMGGLTNPNIKVIDDKGNTLFDETIVNAVPFYFEHDPSESTMGTKIKLSVNGGSLFEIHTSCSQPILVGMLFGDFKIIAGESLNGGPLCGMDPVDPPQNNCGDCDGHVSRLTLRYYGDLSSHDFRITDKEDYNESFNGISNSTEFTTADLSETKNTLYLYVDNVLNTEIHVSCSQPIMSGMSFGDFYIVSGASTKGGDFCEAPQLKQEETAYAYDKDKEKCFTEISEITSSNWGWSNGDYSGVDDDDYNDSDFEPYSLQLYAGAGGCDIDSAIPVGKLELAYNKETGHVKVTYKANYGVEFDALHLYVGYDKYQIGNESVAPGLFPYTSETLVDTERNTYTFEFDLADNDSDPNNDFAKIYVIAHADVVPASK